LADIRLITFDLDNTLWDVGQVIQQAEETMNAWLDTEVPEYRHRIDRDARMELREQVIAELPEASFNVSALREEILYRGMLLCGLEKNQARDHARQAFSTFFEARQQVVFYDNALESLRHLAEHFELAALTNGNADIAMIGLDRYFSFAFSSADVAASKPAPDIFHAALQQAGVSAEESIHVGDNLLDDIHGAGSVGMHTIWIRHADQPESVTHTQPSEVVEHLIDLPEAVARIRDNSS
jgi:putative hydrolase of the HAD superfamily